MDPEQILRNMLAAALPFVEARRKQTGGFGATRRLPATIQDTYHSLNILNLSRHKGAIATALPLCPDEQNLRAYLAACIRLLPATGIETAFRLLWSCSRAGVAIDHRDVESTVLARMQPHASREEWYYCARILVEILDTDPRRTTESPVPANIVTGAWRCADEVWQLIYLARAFGAALPLPMPELIAWLQACQNGDGGFGFFPGTTSFVENCHACLRALALLGPGPLDREAAGLFLARCQTAAGGFSRNGRAAPFLDATWHAVAAYALVGFRTG